MIVVRPRSRSARAAILWGVGFFVLVQASLLVITDTWWLQGRDPVFAFQLRTLHQRLAMARTSHTGLSGPAARPVRLIVALGSSRVQNGFSGRALEAQLNRDLGGPFVVHNLGIPGAGPLDELLTLKRLEALDIRPDLVLIEVLPLTLPDGPIMSKWSQAIEHLSWNDLRTIHKGGLALDSVRRIWWPAVAVPVYSRRLSILSAVWPSERHPSLCGDIGWLQVLDETDWYKQPDGPPELRQKYFEHVQAGYGKGIGLDPDPRHCQALPLLLEECRRQGISAALVLMPESAVFRSWYRPGDWQAIHALVDSLSRQYQVPVVNARDWAPDEQEFVDGCHHLTGTGAVKFCKRLHKEFLLPFWRGQPLLLGYCESEQAPLKAAEETVGAP